jgi:hypothetical protein
MRLPVITAVICAVTGCAYRGSARPDSMADLGSVMGRECHTARDPAHLPQPADLVDPARLMTALAGRNAGKGTTILTLRFGVDGAATRSEVLVAGAGYESSLAVRDAVRRSLLPQRAVSRGWGVRLLVGTSAGAPRLGVARQEVCPPQLLDGSGVPGVVYTTDADTPPAGFGADPFDNGAGGSTRVHARVLVSDRGRVIGFSADEAPDASEPGLPPAAESGPLPWLYSLSFEPALVDGLPTDSWVDLWVMLRGSGAGGAHADH